MIDALERIAQAIENAQLLWGFAVLSIFPPVRKAIAWAFRWLLARLERALARHFVTKAELQAHIDETKAHGVDSG